MPLVAAFASNSFAASCTAPYQEDGFTRQLCVGIVNNVGYTQNGDVIYTLPSVTTTACQLTSAPSGAGSNWFRLPTSHPNFTRMANAVELSLSLRTRLYTAVQANNDGSCNIILIWRDASNNPDF